MMETCTQGENSQTDIKKENHDKRKSRIKIHRLKEDLSIEATEWLRGSVMNLCGFLSEE